MKTVTTKKELANAIKANEDQVIITGDLVKGIIRIKLTGKIAWIAAIASIGTAIFLIITSPEVAIGTGGVGSTVSFTGAATAAGAAATILGLPTAIIAIGIGVSAGGVGVLNKIKNNYSIIEKGADFVILKIN